MFQESIQFDLPVLPWIWKNTDYQPKNKEQTIHFVFHAPCADGFGAAWAYYCSLRANPPEVPTKVIFTPENHRFAKTQAILDRVSLDKETVIFADICPPRDMLIKIHKRAYSTEVYDHHETAERDCGDLSYTYFDMKRSGAGIIWDTFNPKLARPFLIDCVEDGDLWKWVVPGSKEVLIVMQVTTRFKFEQYDAFNKRLTDDLEGVLLEGKYYVRYREVVTQMLTGRKVHKMIIKGQKMPAVNCPIFQSGVGNVLVKKIGPCAAIYYWNGQYWAFSLRSSNEGPNVAKIAEKFGGGGHHSAAGFRVDSLAELQAMDITFEQYDEDEQDEIEELLSPTQVDRLDASWVIDLTLEN
jgi:oligoribonuclease NrnB/cAMP/cGMP phosphodiesterase (DHH superfamily)